MKILFSPAHYIFDDHRLGSEPYATFNIVDRIATKNSESVVITGSVNLLTKKDYQIFEVQPKVQDYNMSFYRAVIFSIRYTFFTFKVLMKTKFDIIHHVRPFALESTFNLIPILGINGSTPFVIGSFSSTYLKEDDGTSDSFLTKIFAFLIKPILKALSIATLRKATKVIVYDSYTKSQVLHYIDESHICIIPPGKDKKTWELNISKRSLKNPKLLYVGNLIPRKGVDLLIQGTALVIKSRPSLKLHIVGDGVQRKELEQLVKSLGIEESVIFEGSVENRLIQKHYESANLFCGMQREASFDQVYIEALAASLPIVTTDNVASREIIQGKDVGITVPQNDINAFSEAVLHLLSNEESLQKISERARKCFEEHYDWDSVIIPRYLELYKSLIKKSQ